MNMTASQSRKIVAMPVTAFVTVSCHSRFAVSANLLLIG